MQLIHLLRLAYPCCCAILASFATASFGAGEAAATGAAETRVFVDSAGRHIGVPREVGRIYAAGPPAAIILYTLAPQKLIGWNRGLTREELAFVPPRYRELPELGRLTGRGNTANVEVVLKAKPDVILDYGSVRRTFVSLADRVQEQTGIPYALLDGSFQKIPQVYRLLGRLSGEALRAEQLAAYAERTAAEVATLLARVPPEHRPRVYYGRGPDGLETGLGGSINVELLERVGAINVAAEGGERGGLATVSMEQILKWNPEVVLTLDPNFYELVKTDPLWRDIAAVRHGRVYLAPNLPFGRSNHPNGRFDRPPSVNRLVGVKWLLSVLYPRHIAMDLRKEAREFYRLFYHIDLSEPELDVLLRRAMGPAS